MAPQVHALVEFAEHCDEYLAPLVPYEMTVHQDEGEGVATG